MTKPIQPKTLTESDKERLTQPPCGILFSASSLTSKSDRTLAYGYTIERETFHVYLMNGIIHRVIYNSDKELLAHRSGRSLPVKLLVPNKRLYPETCDLNFCELIHPYFEDGLPLTTYNSNRPVSEDGFYGDLLCELKSPQFLAS